MSTSRTTRKIENLLQGGKWEEARRLLERELSGQPDNHWLLTQLAVAHYEQGHYKEALRLLLDSQRILPDCPLTLWNLAGTLDALGKPALAIPIYTWLLKSKKSASDDPCWESDEWTETLKTDCVYRLGVCFDNAGRTKSAEHCFREYINLLLAGIDGSYPLEDAAQRVRTMHDNGKAPGKKVREAIRSTLNAPGVPAIKRGRPRLPELSLDEVLSS